MSTPTLGRETSVEWATSEEDWDGHKSLIKWLYIDQDITLKKLMSIMEHELHFKASYGIRGNFSCRR